MSSNCVIIENPSNTNIQLSSPTDLYSTYKTHSSSPNLSHSSSSSSLSNKNNPNSSSINKINSNSSHRKESTLKLPYPVLSDHRDPSSILILLQKETQRTSKKISDVIQQIEECEKRLTLNLSTDNEKKTFKYERVKLKQQLDGLKKHERRVSLQIDFITTKTEIKGLEDELNSDDSEQIKILLGKLKQKLDKMKIYMRQRNEQMKKISNTKQRLNNSNDNRKSSSQKQPPRKDLLQNQKRSSTSGNNSHLNKRLKSTPPIVRLTSRVTSHDSKIHSIQPPIVRFINKTTNSKINSASPTTPASSSSTLSPPLIATTSISNANKIKKSLQHVRNNFREKFFIQF
jgi:hypothetical protein